MLWIGLQRWYSQYLIFFVTYEWAEPAKVLYCTRLERLAIIKHSSLLGPLLSYGEKEVLLIWLQRPYSQYLIFFVTYEWAQHAKVLHCTRLERLANGKHSRLLGPLLSYGEEEVLLIWLQRPYSRYLIFFVTYSSTSWIVTLHSAGKTCHYQTL